MCPSGQPSEMSYGNVAFKLWLNSQVMALMKHGGDSMGTVSGGISVSGYWHERSSALVFFGAGAICGGEVESCKKQDPPGLLWIHAFGSFKYSRFL